MFALAFLIGLYGNVILLLGLINLYTKPVLLGFTLFYLFLSIIFWQKFDDVLNVKGFLNEGKYQLKNQPLAVVFLVVCIAIMVIGALAPETAFDSLWYHLTLPKIFLREHGLRYVPGGLLYYSTMPKLGELLYIPALAFSSEILAKLIHLQFALLTGIALFCIAKRYLPREFALLSVVILFTNIVFLWEGTTAYIDLIRTFFELMALWGLLHYLQTNKLKWLIESALLLSLAIETKLVALASLVVFSCIIYIYSHLQSRVRRVYHLIFYWLLVTLAPLPWFVFSYLQTGNPFYPLFSGYQIHLGKDTLAFPGIFFDLFTVFIRSADPVSPLYLIFLPLLFLAWKKLSSSEKIIFSFAGLALIMWTVTPKTGGGRFLLTYLPVISLAAAILLYHIRQQQALFKISLFALCLVAITTLAYRGVATYKYIPVVLGLQSKQEFLTQHLNFSFGDFFDTDGELRKRVKPSDTVLLYGFHNLYYMDVPFIDASWVRPGDTFNYIATQHTPLPKRFSFWQPIYTNKTTGVTLYTAGSRWIY